MAKGVKKAASEFSNEPSIPRGKYTVRAVCPKCKALTLEEVEVKYHTKAFKKGEEIPVRCRKESCGGRLKFTAVYHIHKEK